MENNKPKLVGIDRVALQEKCPPDDHSYEPVVRRNVRDGVPLPPAYSRQTVHPSRSSSGLQIVLAVLLCIMIILSTQAYLTVKEESERVVAVSSMLAELQARTTSLGTVVVISTSTTVTTSTSVEASTSFLLRTTTVTTTITRTTNTTVTTRIPG